MASKGLSENPPDASALVESLRAFGYSFVAAVSDVVDNSIAAEAKLVDIKLHWAGTKSAIAVADDGRGMAADELAGAMKLGAKSPLEKRATGDLGRFGLGLKTASFSQGRRLTVVTRQEGVESTLVWDLDTIRKTGLWMMEDKPSAVGQRLSSDLLGRRDSGTAVIVEKLDRLVGSARADDEQAHDAFLQKADMLLRHLALVYHRFMSGRGSVRLRVNTAEVDAWDPFLEAHAATQKLETEYLPTGNGRSMSVAPYILPHHARLSADQHESASGPKGWNAHQGFFVYRNKRLLIDGGWLGLGVKQEEHYKLARIRLDLTNEDDHVWQVDVKKSGAVVPDALAPDLRRIAQYARGKASEIYRHRGRVIARKGSVDTSFVWQSLSKHGRTKYIINRKHPLVTQIRDLDGSSAALSALLRLVEETIPIPLITIEASENPDIDTTPFRGEKSDLVLGVARAVYEALKHKGHSHKAAIQKLSSMDPFQHHPEIIGLLASESA
jgi:hypothetical protein